MDGWWISPIWCSTATIFRLKHFLPRSIFPNQAVNLIAEKSAWVPWFKKGGGIGVLGTFGEVIGFQERFVYCMYIDVYICIYIYMTKNIRKKRIQNLPLTYSEPPGVEIRTKPGDKSGHWAAAKSWDPWGKPTVVIKVRDLMRKLNGIFNNNKFWLHLESRSSFIVILAWKHGVAFFSLKLSDVDLKVIVGKARKPFKRWYFKITQGSLRALIWMPRVNFRNLWYFGYLWTLDGHFFPANKNHSGMIQTLLRMRKNATDYRMAEICSLLHHLKQLAVSGGM